MSYILIVLYAMSLVYFALSERVVTLVIILSMQGLMLFGVAFFNLTEVDMFDFIFILTETILVKALIIPWFMNRVRRYNQLKRMREPYIPVFYSIIVIIICLIVSFLLSNSLQYEQLHTKYFTISFASIIFGIYYIIIHRSIFTHVVGYLIIENGIFLLSLAVGNKMPLMVNLAVLLDVFMGVLVLGVFINKIGDTFNSVEVEHLSKLKD